MKEGNLHLQLVLKAVGFDGIRQGQHIKKEQQSAENRSLSDPGKRGIAKEELPSTESLKAQTKR